MVGPDGSVGIQGLSTVSLATAAEFDATLSTRLKRYVTSHPSDGVIDPFDSDRKRESRSLSHFALFVDAFDEADDEDEKRGGPRWGHLVFLFLADPLLQPTKSLDFSSGRLCASHHRDERPPFSSNVQWAVALTAVLVQAARVAALANATQTAAASRGAPPFHKSKLTMLLKGPTPLVVVTPPEAFAAHSITSVLAFVPTFADHRPALLDALAIAMKFHAALASKVHPHCFELDSEANGAQAAVWDNAIRAVPRGSEAEGWEAQGACMSNPPTRT
jgi:hypothetical protein